MKTLTRYLFILFLLIYSSVSAQDKTLTLGKAIESPMFEEEHHTYQVVLELGQFVHVTVEQIGIDLVISVLDPNGEKIDEVDSPIGAWGTENVLIEAEMSGNYHLEIHRFGGEGSENQPASGKYKIQIKELLSAAEYTKRIEVQRARHQAAIQWLRENAIQLKGVEAEQGFDDMHPLKQIIGDAHLVALGEATHGTREFFQLKHRMLEFLVSEMGFNIFAIEATMPEGFDVNEYVLTGKGDPEKALAGLYFWTWNTEEVLDMIHWMRRYNADPSHTQKVKYYGFDMEFSTRASKVVNNYLKKVNKNLAKTFNKNSSIGMLMNPFLASDFRDISLDEKNKLLKSVDSIIKDLNSNKKQYISQTNKKDWEFAQLHLRILKQYIQFNISNWAGMAGIRDSSMAANIRWILEHEGPDAKMVIWAHNGHVANNKNYGGTGSLGYHLRKMYGKDMIIFGTKFNQGSFQAIELPIDNGGRLRPFHVKPIVEEESLDATLGATGLPYMAIDLRRLPEDGYVAEWFAIPHKSREIGSTFRHGRSFFPRTQQVVGLYDVLLFVNETTSSRPNPGGTRGKKRKLALPENLDFESGEVALIPEGWSAHKYQLANFDFTVETSTERPQQGKKCVKISRKSGKHYGETFGSLSQHIDATPYHGKRIKLRAAVRAEVEDPGNHAYLWLSVTKQGSGARSRLFKDNMKDRPITTGDWRFFEITTHEEVSDEAQWINFGMVLTGEGSAWFDSFSLEIVEPEGPTKSQ